MAARITTALLQNTCATLNSLCGTPVNGLTRNADNDLVWSIGHYMVEGRTLVQITSERGSQSGIAYGSKSELLAFMYGMIRVLRNQHKTAA